MKSSSKTKRATATSARSAAALAPAPLPGRSSHFWPIAGAIAAAVMIVFFVYGPSMNGPFLLDDNYLPYRLKEFINAPLRAWIGLTRPLLYFSFWLNLHTSGQSTFGYHLVNVALHCLNGLWVYLALRRVLEWAGAVKWTREATAVFGTGLFLLHPLQTESVSYIASRSELLSICFFLAAFVVFLYRKPAQSIGATLAVLALYGAACLSKEHTVILPALLLLTDYFWNSAARDNRARPQAGPAFTFEGIRRNWRLYSVIAVLGALGGAFILTIVLRGATTAGFHIKGMTWLEYFFTQCRVLWMYILAFVFPFSLNVDADIAVSKNVLDHGAIIGLLALIGVSAAAWIYRRRFPIASYGWFVFLLLIAPTSSFVPIADVYAERRLYMPFIGLVFIVAGFVPRWKASRGTLAAALAGVLLFEGVLTYQRNYVWGDALALWKDTSEKSPNKIRPAWQFGLALTEAGRCGDAVNEYSRAAGLGPPEYGLMIDWALAYDCSGNPGQALAKFQQAAAAQPSAHAFSQIGMEYAKQGNWAEAMKALNRSLQIDPAYVKSYIYRGGVYESQGDMANAAAEYRHALSIDPENQEAQQALARVAH